MKMRDCDIRPSYYILNGRTMRAVTLTEWVAWVEKAGAKRTVQKTSTPLVHISTMFLGLDHNYSFKGPPLIFETLVFGGSLDEHMDRYATYDEAETGHERMVKRVYNDVRWYRRLVERVRRALRIER